MKTIQYGGDERNGVVFEYSFSLLAMEKGRRDEYLKKKLEELNLVDDFLFGAVLSYPGIGEKFARLLLETVFGRKLGKLTVIPQKTYYGGDTDQHGARHPASCARCSDILNIRFQRTRKVSR